MWIDVMTQRSRKDHPAYIRRRAERIRHRLIVLMLVAAWCGSIAAFAAVAAGLM